MDRLPATPASPLDTTGEPRLGAYEGGLADGSLAARRARVGRLGSFAKEKRWIYGCIAKENLWVGFAIVDLGYTTSAFAFVADPTREVIVDAAAIGLPRVSARVADRPEEGCDARFRAPGLRASLVRPVGSGVYELAIDLPRVAVTATLDTKAAPPPLVAIAMPPDGDVNVTQKRAGLAVHGSLVIDGRRQDLAGALGGLDYTHGFLPRHTAWRWAFLLGRTSEGEPYGMNLVEGFNGAVECGVFLGDRAIPVGEGRFHFDRENPLHKWVITTADGAVDLTMKPVGMHADEQNFGVVRSRFRQPVGLFEGTIRVGDRTLEVRAPGVTEDQDMLW